jgi:pentatricopeptide repeat protein
VSHCNVAMNRVCRCGNYEEARELLKQALELNPHHPPALLERELVNKTAQSADGEAKQQ